jgi:hypothetical protein
LVGISMQSRRRISGRTFPRRSRCWRHSFKSPAIAAAIARYSLLRHGAAICVHV